MRLPQKRSQRLAIEIGALVLIAILCWTLLRHFTQRPPPPAPPPPPVRVVTAQARPTPIVLRGLGQVQAFNTETVRSRVDGAITAVRFSEGQHVHRGDLLVQIDPRPFEVQLAQARAAQARDQAQLDNARRDLNRDRQLLKPGLVTQQAFDAQRALVAQLGAAVLQDRAQVDQARLNIDYAAVRASFSGRTGVRLVDLGNIVQTNQTSLLVITQLTPIFVTFTLPERYLADLRDAMNKGRVDVLAFDSGDRRALAQGELKVLDNTVDTSSGTIRLKAQYPNEDETLWPGEFINAHVIAAVREQGITVPVAAVQQGPQGSFVLRVTPDNVVHISLVTVAQVEDNQALIDRGVQAGDRIVVDGAYGLANGARVSIQNTEPRQ